MSNTMPPSSDPEHPGRADGTIPDAELVAAEPAAPTYKRPAFEPPARDVPAYDTPPLDAPAAAPRFGARDAAGPTAAEAARASRLGATLGGLALLGVVLEAGALAYGWSHPPVSPTLAQDSARLQDLDGQVQAAKQQRDALSAQLDKSQNRLAALEARPAPNLAPIEQRLAALEKPGPIASTDTSELARRLDSIAGRQDQLAARQQADVNTLSGRTDAAVAQATTAAAAATAALGKQLDAAQATLGRQLDAAQAADKAARDALANSLSGRIDATTAQAATAVTAAAAALSGRVDAAQADDKAARDALSASLGGRIDAATAQDSKALAALSGRVDSLDSRLGTVEQSSGKVAGLAARAGTMAKLQSAQDHLAAGQKLGVIPGAPPALARYADTAPPTDASLRLSFADAAEAARLASQPQNAGRPFLDRIWSRVQQAVVVRQGDDVIVGDPAAGVLARATDAMNAGDLAGTVEIVETLQGPARQAMADWLAQAHGLLDARAALSSLVAHS